MAYLPLASLCYWRYAEHRQPSSWLSLGDTGKPTGDTGPFYTFAPDRA
jgi:hypothetical protein